MHSVSADSNRILTIDDNPAIHEDFRKIFGDGHATAGALTELATALFGDAPEARARCVFQIDSALQGEEGVALVRRARDEGRAYALAFVDVRMPPGLDGVETAARIWELDSDMQIVICTAYSDYSWVDIGKKLDRPHRWAILKKPFDNIEVLQLAHALTENWRLARQTRHRLDELERLVNERTRELHAVQAQLKATQAHAE